MLRMARVMAGPTPETDSSLRARLLSVLVAKPSRVGLPSTTGRMVNSWQSSPRASELEVGRDTLSS